MDPVKIIIFTLIIILVIIVGVFLYIVRRNAIMTGGNDVNETDESLIMRIQSVYENFQNLTSMVRSKTYDQLDSGQKETVGKTIVNIINGVTGLNIILDKYDSNDHDTDSAISLDWLVKSGMWKMLIMQFVVKLGDMFTIALTRMQESKDRFINAMQNIIPYYDGIQGGAGTLVAIFGLLVASSITIVLIVGMISAIVVEMAIIGTIAVTGIATVGATAVTFIAAIYTVINMYLNYQLRKAVIEKLDSEEAVMEVGVKLATEDVSNNEMREFMKFSIGGSTNVIKSVSMRGLNVISASAQSAINSIGSTGSSAISGITTASTVIPAFGGGSWPNITKEIGSYIEVGNAIQNHLVRYNPEMVNECIDLLYNPSEVMEVFQKSRSNPAFQLLQNIVIGLVAINYKLKGEI